MSSPREKLGERIGSVGEYLADQRRQAELSLRQLSELAGVSNPYLSQIERGLRKPSAQVLHQLATALQISAGSLFVRAGVLDPDDDGHRTTGPTGVAEAVAADPDLTDRQKRLLLDLYASFVQADAEPATRRAASTTAKKTAKRTTTRTTKKTTAKA